MKTELKKDTNKLYDFNYEEKSDKKAKKKKADIKSASKKKEKNKKSSEKNGQAVQKKKYDDEIIIGVTEYPDKKKIENKNKQSNKKNKEKNTKRRKKQTNIEQYNVEKTKVNNEKNNNIKEEKNKKKRNKILKIITLLLLIVAAITFALLSPIFNIQNIEIIGNDQISKEEIISLSGINIDENIFKIQKLKIVNRIKENAYINNVKVRRVLPNKIQIEVVEREPSYMLEYGNGYVYINNQGYMLEISSIKKELPILMGLCTSKENYKEGNRLNEEDLEKLGTVIKIMNAAQSNNIFNLITKVDISDSNNYTLYFETERKVAYLGDCTNLETRILFLVSILEKEKECAGEIFINMNVNTDDVFFRENV